MKVALAADWLPTFGGAEHVLALLCDMYPNAPLFTTLASHGKLAALDSCDIRTSSAQRLYRLTKNHQILLPFLPAAMEELDVRGYDVVLSSSHVVGKGIIPDSTSLHVCYCHTPARYAWEMEDEYLDDFSIPGWLRPVIKKQLMKLRRWDMTTAKRVDAFMANSTTTQERIKRIYNRESTVINPPADDRFFAHDITTNTVDKDGYFVAVGRLVPYKRFDLLIEVANELRLPLKIAGKGQDIARLKKLAGPTVEFLGFVSNDDLPALYANARAFFFPQYEDAGVVPVEAQACGTPVIAYHKGGSRDSVNDGVTGVFFEEQTSESIIDAIHRFNAVPWQRDSIRAWSEKFTQEKFQDAVRTFVENQYEQHQRHPARRRS